MNILLNRNINFSEMLRFLLLLFLKISTETLQLFTKRIFRCRKTLSNSSVLLSIKCSLPKDFRSACSLSLSFWHFSLLRSVYLVYRINLLLIDIFLCLVLLDDTLFLNFIQAHMKFIFCAVDNVRMRGWIHARVTGNNNISTFLLTWAQFTSTNYFTSLPKQPQAAISIIHLPSLEHIDVCNLNFPSSTRKISTQHFSGDPKRDHN